MGRWGSGYEAPRLLVELERSLRYGLMERLGFLGEEAQKIEHLKYELLSLGFWSRYVRKRRIQLRIQTCSVNDSSEHGLNYVRDVNRSRLRWRTVWIAPDTLRAWQIFHGITSKNIF